ncbi:MAG TPA: Spy/CpxP family protein refolding chaperone [Gemmatimonadaceae bacterium]
MKHIRVSLAALLVIGGATVASAQQTQPPANGHGAHGQFGRRAKGPGGPGLRGALMRGITLSDAEKANLKSVNERYASQMKALGEQYKPDHQAMRDARQRHDTAAVKALWEKAAPQREAMKSLLEAQRNDVRAALTPANQALFDANIAKVKERVGQRGDKAGKPFGRRPDPRGSGE